MTSRWGVVGAAVLVLLAATAGAFGQPADAGKGAKKEAKGKDPQGPPDEQRAIVKEIEEAYKAPFEVHEDVLKELRKSYQQPTPEREKKIFFELRRLYQMSPEQEDAVLREIRRAYQQPTAEQEERLFQLIQKADRLPVGAVPATIQAEQAQKLFRKLDLNGDGVLSGDELPDALKAERARWDANRNGAIEPDEYWAYYQGRLRSLTEQVVSGQIPLKSAKAAALAVASPPMANPVTVEVAPKDKDTEEGRPVVVRPGKFPPGVPDWFIALDTDADGQVGLYEWKTSGRPLAEFFRMDRNGDGFLTVQELLFYLAQQAKSRPEGSSRDQAPTVKADGRP